MLKRMLIFQTHYEPHMCASTAAHHLAKNAVKYLHFHNIESDNKTMQKLGKRNL